MPGDGGIGYHDAIMKPIRTAPFLVAALMAGCTTLSPEPADCPRCGDPASPQIRKAYARAVRASRHPKPAKVARDLEPVVASNDQLIWRDGRVLMVSWTKSKYYQGEHHAAGQTFPLAVDVWFMPAPFVADFCRDLELDAGDLTLRLEQYIGLPPANGKDAFLEVWVDPSDLFRPCPDPEIDDRECRVDIHDHGTGTRKVRKSHRLPGACDAAPSSQHVTWMCENWRGSYQPKDVFERYPWTALGYTYDWGNPNDPRGVSEYVALKGSEVTFHSLTPTATYCSP